MGPRRLLTAVDYPLPMQISHEDLLEVDRIFGDYFNLGKTPGLVYAVTYQDRILHTKGLGVSSLNGSTPDSQTVFRVASMTKSFAAAAALILRDRNLLDLDRPITEYFPEFGAVRIPFPDSPEITLRMLLTMSAGFPTDDKWADRQESLTPSEFMKLIGSGLRFDTVPGTKFEYSNLGYALVAAVISNVSGEPFTKFVEREILRPLKMTSSGFEFRLLENLATGYVKRNDTWHAEPFSGQGEFSAIGGLLTNISDLSEWIGSMIQAFNHEPIDQHNSISSISRREMQQSHRIMPSSQLRQLGAPTISATGYGFGLVVEEDFDFGKVVGHSGGYPGFGSHMRWHIGSRIGLIALANGRYAFPAAACADALRYLLERYVSPESAHRLPEELHEVQKLVELLIRNWDNSIADQIFADNMDLDHPRSYRESQIAREITKLGSLLDTRIATDTKSDSPSHLSWKLSGHHGVLAIEIRLAPNLPAKIQLLNVSAIDLLDA